MLNYLDFPLNIGDGVNEGLNRTSKISEWYIIVHGR